MTDREKIIAEIVRLLEAAPETALEFVLHFLWQW